MKSFITNLSPITLTAQPFISSLMKKAVLFCAICLLFCQAEARKYPGHIVTLEGDTVACTFNVRVNAIHNELKPNTFNKRVTVIHEGGRIVKYSPRQIAGFQINRTKHGSQTFVPLEIGNRLLFVRLIEEGDLSLYMTYGTHMYDYSTTWAYVIKLKDQRSKVIKKISWREPMWKYLGYDAWFGEVMNDSRYRQLPEIVKEYNLEHKTAAGDADLNAGTDQ